MNIKLFFGAGHLFLTLLFLLQYNTVGAEERSPWQWSLVLNQDKPGDAMVMPTSLYIDPDKKQYYVVDSGNNRLLSFDRNGELLTIFTAGNELDNPFDMVRIDEDGLWVVEKGKNSLSYIDLKARQVKSHILRYNGRVIYPDRLEKAERNLYVLDKAKGDIFRLGNNLEPEVIFTCSDCPWGFVDFKISENELRALDQRQKMIYRFQLDGTLKEKTDLGDTLNFPVSLAVGPSGYMYIADRHNRNINVYDKEGIFKYSFLDKGSSRGRIYYPSEIRFDPWGGLCVVDEGNSRVEVFTR